MVNTKNKVFIATSLDGYIADKKGGIEWLETIENPEQQDMGYVNFMSNIDALVMGRGTYETVLGFDIEWPYAKPVFVLSSTLKIIPKHIEDRVFIMNGKLTLILEQLYNKGFKNLYIDGGSTINSFLREDLIDELILTTIPIVLGGGVPLFKDLPKALTFELISTRTFLNQITQRHYKRKR